MADMLITLEELASYLQEDVDTATATLAIETATALVQAATSQRLIYVADDVITLYLDEYDTSHWLELPELPVSAVGPVQIGTLPVTDWVTDLSRGRLYRLWTWRSRIVYPSVWAPTQVTITYTHGWQAGARELEFARSACLVAAAGVYSNPGVALREQIDDYAVQYAATAPAVLGPDVVAALRKRYGRGPRSALLLKG